MASTKTPLMITLQETGRMIGTGQTTVRALIHKGDLAAYKIGRRTVVSHDSLLQFISNLPKADLRGPAKKAA